MLLTDFTDGTDRAERGGRIVYTCAICERIERRCYERFLSLFASELLLLHFRVGLMRSFEFREYQFLLFECVH